MSKKEAERCKKIEVWWILKNIHKTGGYKSSTVTWGDKGDKGSIGVTVNIREPNSYIEFRYSITRNGTDEKKDFNYRAQIIATPCNYGGKRYWFICPLSTNGIYCGKRVGVFYQAYNYFGCRNCSNLTYSSRNENRNGRLSYFKEVFDVEDKLEKLQSKKHNLFYGGKLTKTSKKIQKLLQRKMTAYSDFEFQEKRLLSGLSNKKGRLGVKKVL